MAERHFYRKTFDKKSLKKEGRKKRITIYVLFSLLVLFILTILSGIGVFIYYAKDLPRPEKFTERSFIESTKIYDRTGEVLLYELYGETKREIIPLSEMSNNIKNAVIATEDARFYSHHGIDFFGILRAFKLNLDSGKPTYGGSTISQQLIRSTFLTLEKSIARKVKELILTLEMERRYSKDQILEWYLNQVPMGINLYGVQSSSKTYFNKPASELTIAEAAILAASIKAPSYYSPFGNHLDELYGRKDYVIDRMAQENFITEEQAEEAKRQELVFAEVSQTIKAPHFVLHVQEYLFETYGKNFLEERGYRVYTTLDWELQEAAEKAIEEGVEKNKKYKAYNAALVAINPQTGEFLSMVGSANWFGESYPEGCTSGKNCMLDPKLNVSTYRIGRQPGSAFKPFVYAIAFEKGYNGETVVVDEMTNFGTASNPYIPRNYDGYFRGEVTLRQALAQSLNIPSVKVLKNFAGLRHTLEEIKKFGINLSQTPEFYGLSLVLGGGDVKLLEVTSAYGVFATEGYKNNPIFVLKITDKNNNIIEENKKTPRRVLDSGVAREITSILSDNEARSGVFGWNSQLYFPNHEVAAKTGSTSGFRDAWCVGYTKNIVVGVWVGNNDNSSMINAPGVSVAAPLWRDFMLTVLDY